MTRKQILLIEDEEDVAELLRYNLVREGFGVTPVSRGEDGLKTLARQKFDLVLLDLMLPGMSGLEVCRLLKEDPETSDIPIVMVTARTGEADVVTGLEAGAADYVTKPFSMRVLVSRVRAALRGRQSEGYDRRTEIRVRDLVISPSRHLVTLGGKPVRNLTLTEFRLLHFLASRPGWVVNRQQILDAVRGEDVAVTDRAVDVQLVGLRRKLGRGANYIEAVRGVGYRFRDGDRSGGRFLD